MKHVIMIIIAAAAAVGIMFLAYTKKGLKVRKEQGANDYVTGIMMAVIVYFWGMDLLTVINGTAVNLTFTYVFVIGAPVLLIGWIIYTRVKIKELMANPVKAKTKTITPRLK